MASFEQRLASASRFADGRRIVATEIEASFGTRRTVDTLRQLKRRFPRVDFVWIMGADNLTQLPNWHRWREIAALVPMVVVPRPGESRRALAGRAAHVLRHARVSPRHAIDLAGMAAPAWMWLSARENPLSATELRARSGSRAFRGDRP